MKNTNKRSSHPRYGKIFRCLGCLYLAALLVFLSGCAAAKPVEVAPFVRVAFSGYNGEGTAEVALDEAGLADAVYKAMGLRATPEAGSDQAAVADAVLSAVTISATPETGLSNGGSVEVQGTVDTDALREAGVLLTFTNFSAPVAGLDTTRPIDPFENISVSWDGYAPDITMLVTQTNIVDEPWNWISYTTDRNTDLRPGDTVTITASADVDTLSRLGYELSQTTETFTVPDYLGNYLLDWSYLDAMGQTTLKNQAELAAMMANLKGGTGLSLCQNGAELAKLDGSNSLTASNYALYATYFLASATGDKQAEGPGWYNALVGVYSFQVTGGDGESLTLYAAFALPDISMTSTGLVFQSTDAVYYRTADTDPAALRLTPDGGKYRVSAVDFALAATMETATATPAPVATLAPLPTPAPADEPAPEGVLE